ncbi:hypothetical protein DFA_07378 [Cavenderia fasciculata]|uniref:Leucine-rich repeat-containing protein n=1 Tax=Cavenderia fasciculata TaxID=261658 RepID=F4PW91_CACFS|nr:uncharacterized protein DFA_07378 [Cavenderia fasciculata]EGG20255.1 hypothetical protein DFA_07378 [Cavenderia fasciculata]|eukprot:XP_004367238.1 hypothetical protein DFA_07378 [Cavenderia fasciculata]
MTSLHLLKLSNLLLLQIISSIDSNGDVVCLLLTCKQLYHNSIGLRRLVKFKGIEFITDNGGKSDKFIATAFHFNINSFKDILENSISDHQVDHSHYQNNHLPQWVRQRIYATERADKSGITTVLVNDCLPSLPLQPLYDIPSVETLFIDQSGNPYDPRVIDLDAISQLLCLKRLSLRLNEIKLGPHPTLKCLELAGPTYGQPPLLADLGLTKFVSLTKLKLNSYFTSIGIEPGLFPSSLTSLTLRLTEIPPRDTFLSLTSLVYLEIHMKEKITHEPLINLDQEQLFIDLESLTNLQTLKIRGNTAIFLTRYENITISTSVPPSLKILYLQNQWVEIPSRCVMPQLEKLYVEQSLFIKEIISLQSCTSLKKLFIFGCNEIIQANVIPSSIALEKLTIKKYTSENILGQVVFPPSLTHLSIVGGAEIVQLPDSLIKLKQGSTKGTPQLLLPQNLKKLVWYDNTDLESMDKSEEFPYSSSSYPPNLETLKLPDAQEVFKIDVPPITKYLSVSLYSVGSEIYPIFSISSIIANSDQSQWLPPNTTHLTCNLYNGDPYSSTAFNLGEVINHTNVRFLNIDCVMSLVSYQLSIHRLDSENNNVLVLETKSSLQGGIITQKWKPINNLQGSWHQERESIYVYFYWDSRRRHQIQLKSSFVGADFYSDRDTFGDNYLSDDENDDEDEEDDEDQNQNQELENSYD